MSKLINFHFAQIQSSSEHFQKRLICTARENAPRGAARPETAEITGNRRREFQPPGAQVTAETGSGKQKRMRRHAADIAAAAFTFIPRIPVRAVVTVPDRFDDPAGKIRLSVLNQLRGKRILETGHCLIRIRKRRVRNFGRLRLRTDHRSALPRKREKAACVEAVAEVGNKIPAEDRLQRRFALLLVEACHCPCNCEIIVP